jgi:hypothetical protein
MVARSADTWLVDGDPDINIPADIDDKGMIERCQAKGWEHEPVDRDNRRRLVYLFRKPR